MLDTCLQCCVKSSSITEAFPTDISIQQLVFEGFIADYYVRALAERNVYIKIFDIAFSTDHQTCFIFLFSLIRRLANLSNFIDFPVDYRLSHCS